MAAKQKPVITVHLEQLALRLSQEQNRYPLTIDNIAARTGLHRNTILRVFEDPEANVTTKVLGKILECFFAEFRSITKKSVTDAELTQSILDTLLKIDIPKQSGSRKSRKR